MQAEFYGYDWFSQSRVSDISFSDALDLYNRGYTPIVYINRYNLFDIPKILDIFHVSAACFSPVPLSSIRIRFEKYFAKLIHLVSCHGFSVELQDNCLIEILDTIEKNAHKLSEHEYLQAIGPLFEKTFTGPTRVLIDLTSACNTDCIFCRAHSPLSNQRKHNKFLEINPEQLIPELASSGVKNISLVGTGEPSLHPKIKDILRLCHHHKISVDISTNGILLDTIADTLLKYPPNSITVSISAGSQESYALTHPQKNYYEKVIKNCATISRRKHEAGMSLPGLIMLHCINTYTCTEVEQMVEMAHLAEFDVVWIQMLHVEHFSRHLIVKPEQIPLLKKSIENAKERAGHYNIIFENYIDFQLDNLSSDGQWSKNMINTGCYVGWFFTYLGSGNHLNFCCGIRPVLPLDTNNSFADSWFSDEYNLHRILAKSLSVHNSINCPTVPWRDRKRYLYDEFCKSCDNHNFNTDMLRIIEISGISGYIETLPEEGTLQTDITTSKNQILISFSYNSRIPDLVFEIHFLDGPFLLSAYSIPLKNSVTSSVIKIKHNISLSSIKCLCILQTNQRNVNRILAQTAKTVSLFENSGNRCQMNGQMHFSSSSLSYMRNTVRILGAPFYKSSHIGKFSLIFDLPSWCRKFATTVSIVHKNTNLEIYSVTEQFYNEGLSRNFIGFSAEMNVCSEQFIIHFTVIYSGITLSASKEFRVSESFDTPVKGIIHGDLS